MPNGPRIRANNVYGVIGDNPLTAAASTFTSVSLPLLPVVSAAHAVVVLDPKRVYGDPEIVVVIVHTAASTVATILRGQYGTSARLHPQGTAWAHVPIDEDFTEIVTSTTRPTDPYRGQVVFDYDTNRYAGRSTGDNWQQLGFFFDPPACRVYSLVAQSIPNAAETIINFASEQFDTDNMHDNVILNSRITFNTPGLYQISAGLELAVNTTGSRYVFLRVNGSTVIGYDSRANTTGTGYAHFMVSNVWKFNASDYIELGCYQNTAGALNTVPGSGSTLQHTFLAAVWIGRGN